MAHQRSRFCETTVLRALKHAPCVGVVGMRQVGKSTLLKRLATQYFTFDQAEFSARFERQGASLLDTAGYPLALDEIQKHPPAFDALKFSIDSLRRPGRFLVSGSVRFSSRRQIRESLTGRIFLIELYPLNLAECHNHKLSDFLSLVVSCDDAVLVQKLKKRAWATVGQARHFLETGGLPGICFLRDANVRANYFANHIDTLLGRDIQLIRQIKLSVLKLSLILAEIAKNQWLPCNVAGLSRKAGCSQPTTKAVLDALEGLFLIRPFGQTYLLEDAGLSNYLCPLGSSLMRQDMMRCLYHEFRTQLAYGMSNQAAMNHYTTRGGSEIPFLISFKSGQTIAVAVEAEDTPSDKSLKGLTWLKKKNPKTRGLVLCTTNKPFQTPSGVSCFPWNWVF
jgi:predicted AAA+ superfamily ATPase